MLTCTIALGLSDSQGLPLSDALAGGAVEHVNNGLRAFDLPVFTTARGQGHDEAGGFSEDCHVWVVGCPAEDLPILRRLLAVAARDSGQRSVGLTVGTFGEVDAA
jgi:hypothetical protein